MKQKILFTQYAILKKPKNFGVPRLKYISKPFDPLVAVLSFAIAWRVSF